MSYEFNMVDMGGIDLATANGTVVDGLYNKLLEGIDACGNLILYNWKFAEIEIVPSSCTTLKKSSSIVINGLIEVTEQDEVTVLGIAPPPAPVEPLLVESNGIYTAVSPVSGFNPVSVNVPIPRPRLIPISIVANGDYTPPAGVDGFNSVSANVPIPRPRLIPISIVANGDYTPPAGADGFNSVSVNVESGETFESSLAVVDGEYVYSGLSSPGTPYIVDGNFGATDSSRLGFKLASVLNIAVEFDFKIWLANSPGWTFSFGGSNTDSGGFIITNTFFHFYANGTKFYVELPSSLSSGEHNMKIVVHPAYAELYEGDQLIATGNSTYCMSAINYLLSEGEIWLLANRSAGWEHSDSQLNNIKIKIKLGGE